ncbi:MAG: antibiotic biosynthesis monooxygenase [Peptostreptococcaceae bacterium]|nr:antibiotic biosynthesis monooxygenase [Peptostreptococcaceae bacterium]
MENNKLTLVALVKAKEEKRDFVKNEILKLIPITRTEEGNINYNLHQDNNDPNIFILYENWENRELWQNHMNNNHMVNYANATEDATVEWTLHELTKLD